MRKHCANQKLIGGWLKYFNSMQRNNIYNHTKKKRTAVLAVVCLVIHLFAGSGVLFVCAEDVPDAGQSEQINPEMTSQESVNTEREIQEPTNLYAQSAVLMDADSGRVLFAKNGQEERAMASTTKIMTCILALESGKIDETITVSANAASQPVVHLGVREGQQFKLRDLLYSLMLESHNDSAVIIAEAVGGSVEGFADMMNAKAAELDCNHTYFITPNGLDGEDEKGMHHTTAEDLARIMKYCIMDSPQKGLFLEITRTPNYQFMDVEGKQTYTCSNHNAFLQMMAGALSGKTGFTSEAGYCYVGALESQGRTFVVALLACGWPNNKGYKWADTKKLMTYGKEHFHYQTFEKELQIESVEVQGGIPDSGALSGRATVPLTLWESVQAGQSNKQENGKALSPYRTDKDFNNDLNNEKEEKPNNKIRIRKLLRDDEQIQVKYDIADQLTAPVEKGTEVGKAHILLNNEELLTIPIKTTKKIDCRTYRWCAEQLLERILI